MPPPFGFQPLSGDAFSSTTQTPLDPTAVRTIYESAGAPSDSAGRSQGYSRSITESIGAPSDGSGAVIPGVVQTATPNIPGFGAASPRTITLSGVSVGNSVLIVCMETGSGVTWGTPSDTVNVYTPLTVAGAVNNGNAAFNVIAYVAENVTTGGNLTISCPFTGSAGYTAVFAMEISGALIAFDVGTFGSNFSAGPAAPGSFTLTQSNELSLGIAFTSSGGVTFGLSSGYSSIASAPGYLEEYIVEGAGTYNPTSTITGGSANWGMIALGLYSTAAASGVSRMVQYQRSIAESVTGPTDAVSMIHTGGGTSYTRSIAESIGSPTDGGTAETYVQVAPTLETFGPSSPQTVTLTGTTAGNTIVVIVAAQSGALPSSFSTPTGTNTYASATGTSFNDGTTEMAMFYATGIAGGTEIISASWAGTTTSAVAVYAVEISGPSAFDVGAHGSATSTTANAVTSSYAVGHNGSITVAATINTNSATAAGSGFSLIEVTSGFADVIEYGIQSAGSRTAGATLDGTTQSWGIVAGTFYSTASGVSRMVQYQRSIAESIVAPADAVTMIHTGGGTAYTRSIAESTTAPTDAVARAAAFGRAVAESVTNPADAVGRAVAVARSISENVGAPVDAVTRSAAFGRTVAESIAAPADAVARAAANARTIAESVAAPADTVGRAAAFVRSIVESVTGPTDAVSRTSSTGRGVAESIVAPSDNVLRALALRRSIAESIAATSDAITRAQTLFRSIAESIVLPVDSVTAATGQARAVSEGVPGPTDAVARTIALVRAVSESVVSPADAVTRAATASRSFAEAVTPPTDAVDRAVTEARLVSEAVVGPADAVTHATALVRAIAEAVAAPADSADRSTSIARLLAETVTSPTDAVAMQRGAARNVTESVASPSDLADRVVAFVRDVVDGVTPPIDAVDRASGALRSIAETITSPSDLVSAQVAGRSIAESIVSPADLVDRVVTFVRVIVDSISSPSDVVTAVVIPVPPPPPPPAPPRRVQVLSRTSSGGGGGGGSDSFVRAPYFEPKKKIKPDASDTTLPIGVYGRVRSHVDGVVSLDKLDQQIVEVVSDDGKIHSYVGVHDVAPGPKDGDRVAKGDTIGRAVVDVVEHRVELREVVADVEITPTPPTEPEKITIGIRGRVRAEVDGVVSYDEATSVVRVVGDDGIRHVYSGVEQIATGPKTGERVEKGATIGRATSAVVERIADVVEAAVRSSAVVETVNSTPTSAYHPTQNTAETRTTWTGHGKALTPPLPLSPSATAGVGKAAGGPSWAPAAAVLAASVAGAIFLFGRKGKKRSSSVDSSAKGQPKSPPLGHRKQADAQSKAYHPGRKGRSTGGKRRDKLGPTSAGVVIDYPENAAVYEKWIRCGRADCQSCPHGPYLYAKWKEDGRTMNRYLGKKPR